MIFGMKNLKMLFVLIVSIVFLFTKKLDAQTKLKLKTEFNMQTKKPSLPGDMIICDQVIYNCIYIWGFSDELEL